jgi:[ribosomal protein S18]-alanine N-acetyltransferase
MPGPCESLRRVVHLIDPASIHVAPLTRAHAEDVATWSYEPPYDVYDMTGAEPDELLDPAARFHAVLAGETLIGFRSFGPDGQVPGWDYDDSALDTGGGLRPSLTGQGLGRTVIAAGLAFGRSHFAPAAFRVTVASFNHRALRTVASLGFERVGSFDAARDGRPFDVLVRTEAG